MDHLNSEAVTNVVIFDQECAFCAASVRFILKYDRSGELRFAGRNSNYALDLKKEIGVQQLPESILFRQDSKLYKGSDAALQIAIQMGFPAKLTAVFLLVPKFIREPIYRFIADRRLSIMGKADSCYRPDPSKRVRFLA